MSSAEKKKMVIIGLDNAGKSTIIMTMKRQLGPHNLKDLQPTKGLQTEDFETEDTTYHVWDFGGQKSYRDKYLQKPTYFESTDILIFVMDIQDNKRYELALDYMVDILKILKDLGEKCEWSIFFHKFDPEILESGTHQKRSRELRKKIREIFKEYLSPVKVFHTSIYTVFQRIQVM